MLGLLLVVVLYLNNLSQALVPCNGNVTKLQLCFLGSEYDKGIPPNPPMNLLTSVTIFSISEVGLKSLYIYDSVVL